MARERKTRTRKVRAELQALIADGTPAFATATPLQLTDAVHLRKTKAPGANLDDFPAEALDLRGSDFSGASLKNANLKNADLRDANFANCDLSNAHLWGAKCMRADFSGACLRKADMRYINLTKATIKKADLIGSHLNSGDLRGANLSGAKIGHMSDATLDDETVLPTSYLPPQSIVWKGKGPRPGAETRRKKRDVGTLDHPAFMELLAKNVDTSRLKKALSMLKKDSFQLFARVDDEALIGVIKSQSDLNLLYACKLTADGEFSCCTQNLNTCGGLRGKPCKHLLVLVVGLSRNGEFDTTQADRWVDNTRDYKPTLDKDEMGEVFLQYKGAEVGEVDWRPSETVPEDYYLY